MKRRFWIFDMDGTLTVATHNFDQIREVLGLPPGKPILEQLDAMPAKKAKALHRQLDDVERQHASAARPQPGAPELLAALTDAGARMGIATRNTAEMAQVTLTACGIETFFARDHVLGRDCAEPKPSAAGLQALMDRWGAQPHETVMVGDYLFDLQAGRQAGCATVAINPAGRFEWPDLADHCVTELCEILTLPISPL